MMHNKYRVCIAVPDGYQHSQAFVEVAMLLKLSITDIGFKCDVAINELSDDSINIILGYHLISYSDALKNVRYIPYQLEQLSIDQMAYSEESKKILKNACDVWDYSIENIDFLKKDGINAKHLPLGYHPLLERIPQSHENDIDILFFGSGGERRMKILEQLNIDPDIKLQTVFGAYGTIRDNLISKSKIVLNIHAYEAKIFEAVRISYLLNNHVCIITEDSTHYPYKNVPMCRVCYDDIVNTCKNYLNNPKHIETNKKETFESFKKYYKMTDLLSKIFF